VGAPPDRRRLPQRSGSAAARSPGRPGPPRPPADPLVEHDPELLAAAEQLVRRATASPTPRWWSRCASSRRRPHRPTRPARALARAIVCQLAAFHAPDDLRSWPPPPGRPTGLAVDGAAAPLRGWGSAGARPHQSSIIDAIGPGMTVTSPGADGSPPPGPRGRDPADELLERTAAAGGTVIWLAETVSGEPSELSVRVRLDDHGWATLQETAPGGRLVSGIRADLADPGACEHRGPAYGPSPARAAVDSTPARAGRCACSTCSSSPTTRLARPTLDRSGAPRWAAAALPVQAPPRAGRRHPERGSAGPRPQGGGRRRHRPARPGGRGHRLGQERAAADHRGRAGGHPPTGPARLRAGRLQGRRRVRRPGPPCRRWPASSPTCNPTCQWSTAPWPPSGASWSRTPATPARQRQPCRISSPTPPGVRWTQSSNRCPSAGRRRRVRRAPGRPPRVPGPFTAIGRVGRSLGMHLLLAAQRLDEGPPARPGQPPPVPDSACARSAPPSPPRSSGVPDAYHLPRGPRGRPAEGGRGPTGPVHRRPRLSRSGGPGRRA
jgi:hypothetical protein